MTDLEKRFDDEINKSNFNFLEMSGFQKNPRLAILAGIAIGYRMASDDFIGRANNLQDALKEKLK